MLRGWEKATMNVLCLMGLFPKEYEDEILKDSLSGVQNAANKLQWAIVDGLNNSENIQTRILNSLFIGSYPRKYKKAIIPSFPFQVGGKELGMNVGFWNLPGIKYLSKYHGLKKKLDQWIKSDANGEKVVIAYALTSPVVELLRYIKKKYPSVKCVLFVPDLPEYMDVTNKSLLYSIIKKWHISHLRKNIKEIDGYVFLTDYMKEWFDWDICYTVVEGIYKTPPNSSETEISKEKVILYAGGLNEQYGVLALVDAFLKTKEKEWTLELVGDGPLLPTLKRIAVDHPDLVIRGLLPNSEVLKRQKQVSLLVNPRRGEQVFTKYSFPSKTIEYMASGTPMVGYRLPGIPDEYFEYIYEVSPYDHGLEECLKKVMLLSEQERNEFGLSAKHFIQTEKNEAKQCAKILKLVESLVMRCANPESRGSK